MPADPTRNVPLTAELNAFTLAQVASGQHQNASKARRASLRLFVQHARCIELTPLYELGRALRTRHVSREHHARQA
jgi:Arc/MetJ-type ribon-helix-helix transcriptional regulator